MHNESNGGSQGALQLTVTRAGTGSGKVTSSPAGIDCGSTCSGSFQGTVTLTATPANGSVFGGWSGSCTGMGTCSVFSAASVTVTFTPPQNIQAINHIIVLAQENRSFDEYFGALREVILDQMADGDQTAEKALATAQSSTTEVRKWIHVDAANWD